MTPLARLEAMSPADRESLYQQQAAKNGDEHPPQRWCYDPAARRFNQRVGRLLATLNLALAEIHEFLEQSLPAAAELLDDDLFSFTEEWPDRLRALRIVPEDQIVIAESNRIPEEGEDEYLAGHLSYVLDDAAEGHTRNKNRFVNKPRECRNGHEDHTGGSFESCPRCDAADGPLLDDTRGERH